jgi:hypothetical protein
MSLDKISARLAQLKEPPTKPAAKARARDTKAPGPDADLSSLTNNQQREAFDPKRAIPSRVLNLLAQLTEADVTKVVRVWRESMDATRRVWQEPEPGEKRGKWIEEPDAKTRLGAANMVAAYVEGLPVQRQIQIKAEFEGAEETMARFRASPEAMRAAAGLQAAGVPLSVGNEVIDVEASVQEEPVKEDQ